jgi:uncharacterized protein (DUF885 family)
MTLKSLSFLGLLVLSTSCATRPAGTSQTATGSPDSNRLNATIAEYTEASKHLDAFKASYFNVEEDLGKFGDYPSPAFFAREKSVYQKAINGLKAVRFDSLSAQDQRTYRIFKEDMEVSLEAFDYPFELLEFTQMDNRMHAYLDDSSEALTTFPFDTVGHYDAFIARAKTFPAYVDNQIDLLKRGLRENIVLNCPAAHAAVNTYQDGLQADVEKNSFYRPITFMPKSFSAADRQRLDTEFRKFVAEQILPGYQKFDRFFRTKYVPHCRASFGIGKLPHGKAWYNYAILKSTNLALSPKEIHKKGLEEVRRITGELEKVKAEIGFKGSLQEFRASLAQDPRYFFTSSKEMFEAFQKVKSDTSKQIPNYFNLIPSHDYKIVETSNPEDAAGSYNEPTDNIPYGRFVVNTKNLRSVPVYGVTTLSLHETIPGHHFQLALQYEMKDRLSEYQRKLFNSNSFVEGWALYAEFLGNEMGMYRDPVQRLGNLNDEMLRAVRLVVDTGIHAYGWSRKKAVAYMKANLASDDGDISNEINRYSVWPGQALGYKIGQLKIIELRRLAESELGKAFDIKEFHRVVIGSGTVSLGILESQVKDWITRTKASSLR